MKNLKNFCVFAVAALSMGAMSCALADEYDYFVGSGAGSMTLQSAYLGPLPSLPKSADEFGGFKKKAPVLDKEALQRQAVNQMLYDSHELIKQGKYDEALTKLKELDAVQNKTADEKRLVDQTRISIATSTGNNELLTSSIETALATDTLPKETRIQYCEALAGINYRAKNYPQTISWISRYFQEGGQDANMRDIQLRSYFFSGDYAKAAQEVRADIAKAEAAGHAPSEDLLRMLASSGIKSTNHADYIDAVEKLVAYYPKKGYWSDLLDNLVSKPGFPDSLTLDAYRLVQATGHLNTSKDYLDMAQLAMISGYPAEAKKVLNDGFQSGMLGVGPQATKHKQLLQAAQNADAMKAQALGEKSKAGKGQQPDVLVATGFSYADRGQYEKGISLMEEGIHAGGLKHPEDAKLHLGTAYMMAGNKEKAIATFKEVQGDSGAADIAKYWILFLNAPHVAAS